VIVPPVTWGTSDRKVIFAVISPPKESILGQSTSIVVFVALGVDTKFAANTPGIGDRVGIRAIAEGAATLPGRTMSEDAVDVGPDTPAPEPPGIPVINCPIVYVAFVNPTDTTVAVYCVKEVSPVNCTGG